MLEEEEWKFIEYENENIESPYFVSNKGVEYKKLNNIHYKITRTFD